VIRVVVFFLIFYLSACAQDNKSKEQAQNIFPSVLEYQQCLENIDPSDNQYHKVVIEFDAAGHSGYGWAIYDDADCEVLAYRDHEVRSRYTYRLGVQVTNLDGTIGNELVFPDPENSGKSGTVFHIVNDTLCFAKGSVNLNTGFTNYVNLSSIHFTHTSIDGDFSNLEIDRDNCFIINMGE